MDTNIKNTEIYQLSNWINAAKMKNTLNPNIKIDILVLQDSDGYIMTVYEESTKSTNILYRVLIECSLPNNWSLSNEEAITLLNTIGFKCEWVAQEIITKAARDHLLQLKALGWSKIIRIIRPAEVYVVDDTNQSNVLSAVMPNFKYSDWNFLPVSVPVSIEELLLNTATKETEKEEEIPTEST